MSLASLCNTHLVKVERQTTTIDSSGGPVLTWSTLYESVPVTIQPLAAREKVLWAQRQIVYSNKLYTDQNLQLRKEDRVTDLESGQVYVVTAWANMGGRSTAFSSDIREIT